MKSRILLAALATFLSLGLSATRAGAQATRTYVSQSGDDTQNCTRTAPCKTFAGTISKTATGGEINCLDAGGYGSFTITKSITVDCAGTLGSTTASTSTGIVINPAAGSIVTVRNLTITGAPTAFPGNFGVRISAPATVNLENVNINNFRATSPNGFGITINNTAGAVRLYVSGGVISNNGTATSGGAINIQPTMSGQALVYLHNVELTGNWRGINANTSATSTGNTLTMRGGTIFGSIDNAIDGTTGANALNILIDDVGIANNTRGVILAGAGVTTLIGGSIVVQNGTAFSAAGGAVLQSYKDNQINLNSNNATPLAMVAPN